MPVEGPVPGWMLSLVAAATIFAVMFDLGLALVPGEFRWVVQRPALMAKALFAVLVGVPAIAWLVCRAFDLPRAAEIGIMLMAISPGAPVALRRSLGAGGHRAFAPALQILVASLAVVSMPLWVASLSEFYAGDATAAPEGLARQVFMAQLLPLGLGMLARRLLPGVAARVEPPLRRIAGVLLLLLLVLALIDVWHVVIGAGVPAILAIVLITALAAALGHALAGPEPATRTATAVSSAARNPGLALLVATLNHAAPAITATVLAYLFIAALTLVPYVMWRKRAAERADAQGATAPPGRDAQK